MFGDCSLCQGNYYYHKAIVLVLKIPFTQEEKCCYGDNLLCSQKLSLWQPFCFNYCDITIHHGIANLLQCDCSTVCSGRKENIKAPHNWPYVLENHWWSVGSPHTRPVIQSVTMSWRHHALDPDSGLILPALSAVDHAGLCLTIIHPWANYVDTVWCPYNNINPLFTQSDLCSVYVMYLISCYVGINVL